jgi:hypothetical protein
MITTDKALHVALGAIRALTNIACEYAKTHLQDNLDEAINWGDLGCVEVRYCYNNTGVECFQVVVEEADPSCPKLKTYLQEYLCDRIPGLYAFEIVTEW